MKLQGKKSLVIGAGSGIGAGIAEAFVREGADVAFMDLNLGNAEENALAARKRYAGRYLALGIDVGERASVGKAIGAAAAALGGVDIVAYTAGVSYILPFLSCTDEIWDLTMKVNLKGIFLCMQEIIPLMRARGGGSILCLSSQSGKVGASQYEAYCASKFGVIGFVQSLALEFAREKIRVNAICPGVVYTPMWEKQVSSYAKKRNLRDEEVMPYFAGKIPLGRIGTVEDVENAAVFLASDDSSYLTGQALNVCGGQVMT